MKKYLFFIIIIILLHSCNSQFENKSEVVYKNLSLDSIYFKANELNRNEISLGSVNNLDIINGFKGLKFGISLDNFENDLNNSYDIDSFNISKNEIFSQKDIIIYKILNPNIKINNLPITRINLLFYKKTLSKIELMIDKKVEPNISFQYKQFNIPIYQSFLDNFIKFYGNPNIKMTKETDNESDIRFICDIYEPPVKPGIQLNDLLSFSKLNAIWSTEKIALNMLIQVKNSSRNFNNGYVIEKLQVILSFELIDNINFIDKSINKVSDSLSIVEKENKEIIAKDKLIQQF